MDSDRYRYMEMPMEKYLSDQQKLKYETYKRKPIIMKTWEINPF